VKGLLESREPNEIRRSIDYLGVGAFVIDVMPDGAFRVAAINARLEELAGMNHRDVAGRLVDDLLDTATADLVKDNYRRCVQARTAIDYQQALDLPTGRTHTRTILVPLFDIQGRVFRILGVAHDVSDLVHLKSEKRYQSALLSAYLEECPDGILVIDADNSMKMWNRRFLEIWEIPAEVMEAGDGQSALEAVRRQIEDPDAFVDRVMTLSAHLDEEEQDHPIRMRDGRRLERYSRGLRDADGVYWGRIWFYRDVTERERMTEALTRLAVTDPLTNTTNRRAFMEALGEEYLRARRYAHPMSLLMLDLDHFKTIYDRYGHAGGDAALKAFAEVVPPQLRATDHFARMGGEEFAVLLTETDLAEAQAIAERLREAVVALAVDWKPETFSITVSIGVTELRSTDQQPENVLSRADAALYSAKTDGRNRVRTAAKDENSMRGQAEKPGPASA
jgi:diguanylate cyclase (GGDEF)-like protein